MPQAFFTSDLHGRPGRYRALWARVADERPGAVFLGGDLLPHGMDRSWDESGTGDDFVPAFLAAGFRNLRSRLGERYPRVFLVLGNDDPAYIVPDLEAGRNAGLWEYLHRRRTTWAGHDIYGYNCVPPTPFQLKDWERYDVSRYVDPGCISPEEGRRSDDLTTREIRWTTIKEELADLAGDADQRNAIWLFHTPPHDTGLDLTALEGRTIDHVPLDPHVGSIAVREFIRERQPLITLHGHVHETVDRSGRWRETLGTTCAFAGAHGGPELSLVRFDPSDLAAAVRVLIPV
ncbi:MAG: hypothetical protein GY838_04410 [bacterium]|nr:hypothetical protein [bacterium]